MPATVTNALLDVQNVTQQPSCSHQQYYEHANFFANSPSRECNQQRFQGVDWLMHACTSPLCLAYEWKLLRNQKFYLVFRSPVTCHQMFWKKSKLKCLSPACLGSTPINNTANVRLSKISIQSNMNLTRCSTLYSLWCMFAAGLALF